MTNPKTPIFWAMLIQGVFFVLLLLASALNSGEALGTRLLYGAMGFAFILAAIRQLRSPRREEHDPTVSVVLLGLFLTLIGGCSFAFELNSSRPVFIDLLRTPVSLISLLMLPVGLVTLVLAILEIVSNK